MKKGRTGTIWGWVRALQAPIQPRDTRKSESSPDLALTQHNPFERGQALDAHRATGMELVGADADFGAHPILNARHKGGCYCPSRWPNPPHAKIAGHAHGHASGWHRCGARSSG